MRKLNTPTIHWREIPLFRLLIPFLIGVFLGETFPTFSFINHWVLLFGLLLLLIITRHSFDYSKRWISGMAISLFLIGVGAVYVTEYDERKQANYFREDGKTEQTIIGQINSYPKETDKYIKAEVHVVGKKAEEEISSCSGNLLAYFKKRDSLKLDYGDQVVIQSTIQEIPPPKNPLAFDYQQYCHFRNIHFQSFVKEGKWTVVQKQQANYFYQTAYNWQQYFKRIFQKTITNEAAFGIVNAMLLGSREAISEELEETYAATGVLHVLAVSGLHVGILSEIILWLLGLFRKEDARWKRWQLAISLIVIWGFAFIVGNTPSVTRAAIMFSFLTIGRLIRRDIHPLNTLAAAAFFITILDPYALFQVGFQFSFLAVAGIIVFYKSLYRLWIPENRFLYFFWQLFVVGIAAQIAVLPLSVYYFHQIPIYSWLAGLIAVPMASVILYGSLFLLAVSFVNLDVATLVGTFLSSLIEIQNQLMHTIQQLPYAVWEALWIESYEVVLLYGMVICLGLIFITKSVRLLKGALLFMILFMLIQINKKWQQKEQIQLAIYDISKKSVVDMIEGQDLFSLQKDSLTENDINYNLANYRMATAKKINGITIDNILETNHLLVKENYMQIGDKRVVIIDEEMVVDFKPKNRLFCDYILLKNSPRIEIEKLQEVYGFKQLIFDSSNKRSKVSKWETTCKKLSIDYHNTQREGAFVAIIK